MAYNIYLVEDQQDLNDILTHYLKKEGWEIKSFKTGIEAQKHTNDKPDLWILDIMLPGIDGFGLLKEIRSKNKYMPIIFISARNEDFDRIAGLELGCDDYLPKPFLPRELIIRTKNILERAYNNVKNDHSKYIELNDYRIELSKRIVMRGTTIIDLTSLEFDLVAMFVKNNGSSLSRQQILDMVWGIDYFGSDRVVDNTIKRLRKKLAYFDIETIYGYGYRCNIWKTNHYI